MQRIFFTLFVLYLSSISMLALAVQTLAIKSQHPESGELILYEDRYSLAYRDKEGNLFSLYDKNDYYESPAHAFERYQLNRFSLAGGYASIIRGYKACNEGSVVVENGEFKCEEEGMYKSEYDFIDMLTGCLKTSYTYKPYYATRDMVGWESDHIWWFAIYDEDDYETIDISSDKNLNTEASINNVYLCNKDTILNTELNIQTLSKLQSFANLRKNKEALSLVSPLVAFGLAETLSKNNVVFLNDLAFFLEEFNFELDQASTTASNRKLTSSIILLERIIKKFPNRTVAYLNLADAYYKEGFEYNNFKSRIKATENYKIYYDLMQKSNREQRVPSRVLQRIG